MDVGASVASMGLELLVILTFLLTSIFSILGDHCEYGVSGFASTSTSSSPASTNSGTRDSWRQAHWSFIFIGSKNTKTISVSVVQGTVRMYSRILLVTVVASSASELFSFDVGTCGVSPSSIQSGNERAAEVVLVGLSFLPSNFH